MIDKPSGLFKTGNTYLNILQGVAVTAFVIMLAMICFALGILFLSFALEITMP